MQKLLSLIDCLITPKHEDRVMGDLDVETFLLTMSVVLERAEDKLELIPIVVTPLKTTDVGAKEEHYILICTEIDVSWLKQSVSELLAEMHYA